jgi:hypothetical protein
LTGGLLNRRIITVDGKIHQRYHGVESGNVWRFWRQSAAWLLLTRIIAGAKRIACIIKTGVFFSLLAVWAVFLVFISSDEWE